MIRNWRTTGSKRQRISEAENADMMALLGLAGKGNSEGPSLHPGLGENPETKLYVRNNHIYFQDSIEFDTASALNKEINDLATELEFMQNQFGFPEPAPIILHITSPGGCVLAAYGIIDCMEKCKVPVHTVVDSFAASCGTLISIHGVHRTISKNACMLIHQITTTVWGPVTEQEHIDHDVNIKQMSAKIRQFYTDKTNMKKGELKELLKHDMEWDAKECLRRGLVDKIE